MSRDAKNDHISPLWPQPRRACEIIFSCGKRSCYCSNWLIPKRKVLRAVRRSEGRGLMRLSNPLLCLTLALPFETRRDAKVCPYAIGIGTPNATPPGFRLQNAEPSIKPFSEPHPHSSGHSPAMPNASKPDVTYPGSARSGKKNFHQQAMNFPQTRNMVACCVHISRSLGKAPYRRSSRLNGFNRSCLPAVIDSR